MIHWKKSIQKLRNCFNPLEWQMRLLGLEKFNLSGHKRGLILIQIDGLSYPDLERSLRKHYTPFLKQLMRREDYQLHRMYSGIPSNTPAFQGELFFGQAQCVPAFQFLDRETGKIFTMFEKKSAETIEKQLQEKGVSLIAEGSAYGNIFSGGANEAHICASKADIVGVLKAWNPYSVLITLLLSPFVLIRAIFLCAIEIVLSVIDVMRGVISGHNVIMEILFILSRIFSSILVREIATAHVQMDIYRGLPIIHVNFFGYDEQAHRRGPWTRFAYWSLPGIDSAIKKIWNTAASSKNRHYDVWVYSDHGQEKVTPFAKLAGESIHRAVQTIYKETNDLELEQERPRMHESHRVLGCGLKSEACFPAEDSKTESSAKLTITRN